MDFKKIYNEKIKNIDIYIDDYLEKYKTAETNISEAMKYSVLNGGKRLRSILCTEVCVMLGGKYEDAIPFATAIELIHAYSLVHDDLPSMDNSDIRRGQLSCHKKYGEAIGVLCGDALLNSAYEIMFENCSSSCKIKAASQIANAAGALGMVNGQVIDLNIGSQKIVDEQTIIKLVELKTMALIRSAVTAGALISECNEDVFDSINKFAYHLGIAFQIRDDFEDIEQDDTTESDSPNFINAFGRERATDMLKYHSKSAYDILIQYDTNGFLCSFLNFLFA